MPKTLLRYRVGDSEQDYEFTSTFGAGSEEWAAEDAAANFHANHCGWESQWPMVFHVFDGERAIGTFIVEREAQPVFHARKKE